MLHGHGTLLSPEPTQAPTRGTRSKSLESWGCEYLELENNKEFVQYKHKKDYVDIPMSIMAKIVDKSVNTETRRKDGEYIAQLRENIATNGMKNPAEITIGPNSVILTDGNHRYCACLDLGYETFRVRIKTSDQKLKLNGIKVSDIVLELLELL